MHSLRRGRIGMVAAGSLVLSGLGAAGAFAAEPQATSVVTGSPTGSRRPTRTPTPAPTSTPQQDDVAGPQRAPFGTGSHRMRIGSSTVQTELYRTPTYDGSLLSDLTRLEYSTFASAYLGQRRRPARRPTCGSTSTTTTATARATTASSSTRSTTAPGRPTASWQSWDVAGGKVGVDGDAGPGPTTTLAQYAADQPGLHAGQQRRRQARRRRDRVHRRRLTAAATPTRSPTATTSSTGRSSAETDADTLYDFGPNTETTGRHPARDGRPGDLQGWAPPGLRRLDRQRPEHGPGVRARPGHPARPAWAACTSR